MRARRPAPGYAGSGWPRVSSCGSRRPRASRRRDSQLSSGRRRRFAVPGRVAWRGVSGRGRGRVKVGNAGATLPAPIGRNPKSKESCGSMAYVIAEPCIDVLDISCVSVCPVDCIHYEEGTDRKLFIDPNECIDCGACEPECPVNAIFPEESLPPEWASYTQIDATWYTDKAAARAAVDAAKPPV